MVRETRAPRASGAEACFVCAFDSVVDISVTGARHGPVAAPRTACAARLGERLCLQICAAVYVCAAGSSRVA